MRFFLTYLPVIVVVFGAVPTRSSPIASYHGLVNMIRYALQEQKLDEFVYAIEINFLVRILRYIEALPQIRNYLAYLEENYFPVYLILSAFESYLEQPNSDKSASDSRDTIEDSNESNTRTNDDSSHNISKRSASNESTELVPDMTLVWQRLRENMLNYYENRVPLD